MCRLLAYRGRPIVMNTLLYEPYNSLIHQSYHALERHDPVNGDGFGVGWYAPDVNPEPAVFKSIQPAWNNLNLRSLAPRIRTGCMLAHVRAASSGGVTEANCHPFAYRQLLMMHNGNIEDFQLIKRELSNRLDDISFNWIKGETDTEYFFALFLTHLTKRDSKPSVHDAQMALAAAIRELKEIFVLKNITKDFYLNLVVSDGEWVLATRFDTNPRIESPTLYLSKGSRFVCSDTICRMEENNNAQSAVLITSEKLTQRDNYWQLIPELHCVSVTPDLDVTISPMNV